LIQNPNSFKRFLTLENWKVKILGYQLRSQA
jgi:hypothetical protein